jgi:hypothetical protein
MLTESQYKLAEHSQLTSSGVFRHQFTSSYTPSQTEALRTRTSHLLTAHHTIKSKPYLLRHVFSQSRVTLHLLRNPQYYSDPLSPRHHRENY